MMTLPGRSHLLVLATVLLAGPRAGAQVKAVPATADAGQAAAAPGAPAARAPDVILDDFARAIGGAKALGRHKSIYMSRQLTVKGMGMEGSEERWATADGKLLSVTKLPGIGEIRTGSTGKQRWSYDPINGLRILSGAEAEQNRLDTTWKAELELKRLYPKRKPVPVPAGASKSKHASKRLECLEMTPVKVWPVIMCFDSDTHLRVYQEGRQASPQGELPYSAHLSDWREVQGVKIPFLEEMTVGPMSIESQLKEAKLGAKIESGLFKMPKPGKPAASTP